MKNKIPPPIITLVFALLSWSLSLYFPLLQLDFFGINYIAYAIIFFGLCLDIISFLNFLKSKTTVNPIKPHKASKLVIGGFYRFSRNPMYLGMLCLLTGGAILFGDLSSFLVLPLFIITMNYLQIIPEEKALQALFGPEYEQYKERVRRWL